MYWMRLGVALCLTILTPAVSAGTLEDAGNGNWPQWRGPSANGVAPGGNPPVAWSEERNVRFKLEIPGRGSSTPIVWEDRIYLTTAVPTGERVAAPKKPAPTTRGWRPPVNAPTHAHQFLVLALDRKTGETIWRKSVRQALPHEGSHEFGNFAAGSAITDGDFVWAFFGSRGLYCLDRDGNVLWETDFGDMRTRLGFGEGASPVLYRDRLIVPWDHEGESFIVAVNKETGEEIWRRERDESTSWSTPLVIEHEGKAQVVTNATKRVRAYDVETGTVVWESAGMTRNVIPTPVEAGGIVYVMSGFRGNALQAIDLSKAEGDIGGTDAIVWEHGRDTPYTSSPLLHEDNLYFLKTNSNVLSVFNAKTGAQHHQMRLPGVGDVFSSPVTVAGAGRLYITGREGTTVVLEAGPEPRIVATNSLDDGFDASMVIVGDDIYLRGRHLYRIAE